MGAQDWRSPKPTKMGMETVQTLFLSTGDKYKEIPYSNKIRVQHLNQTGGYREGTQILVNKT